MSYSGIDPYNETPTFRENTTFDVGDRFEFKTLYQGQRIIHRGRITKIEKIYSFEGFLDNGTFLCGNTYSLNKIPKLY